MGKKYTKNLPLGVWQVWKKPYAFGTQGNTLQKVPAKIPDKILFFFMK